jgi:hypothetical protein
LLDQLLEALKIALEVVPPRIGWRPCLPLAKRWRNI